MIYPALSDLLKHVNSRYSLVIATAKRARQIVDEGDKLGIAKVDVDEAIALAIDEIANGMVRFKQYDDAYDIYDEAKEST